ncbi:MAG TPA: hypothetical protein VFN95_00430 [Flavitalea sp.]|nr:hypothetical protein [Flavitalea sp.]
MLSKAAEIKISKMNSDFFIGEWSAVAHGAGHMHLDFLDKEHLVISFQGQIQEASYTLKKQDSLATLTTIPSPEATSKFIVIPIGNNTFTFYLGKDFEMESQASKALPGTIGWGWTKPSPIEFKRRFEK